MQQHHANNVDPSRRTGGYTLLEISIVMAVAGILLVSFIGVYKLWNKERIEEVTRANIETVVSSLSAYLVQTGSYPCPARLDVSRGDPLYGIADHIDGAGPDGEDLSACATNTPAVGTCADGVCVEQGERQVNLSPGMGAPVMEFPRVRRGAVPFRQLGLPEKSALDGYGQRLMYAVTENLAVQETYRKDAGGISVVNQYDESMVQPPSSAHFIVFSVGPDGRGAYSMEGGAIKPCGEPDDRMDAVNCHTSSSDSLAVYRSMPLAPTNNEHHFDDNVRYYASVETPLWRVSDKANQHISDLVDAADTAGGRIGVGSTSDGVALDISGHIRAEQNLHATMICDKDNANCFKAGAIGGNDPDFRCDDPANPYIIEISGGRVRCGPAQIRCPMAGSVLRGVRPDGTLDCVTPVIQDCAPAVMNLCEVDGVYETVALPAGEFDEQTGWLPDGPPSGHSYYANFYCSPWHNRWIRNQVWGRCECEDGQEITYEHCAAGLQISDGSYGYYEGQMRYINQWWCNLEGYENGFHEWWSGWITDDCVCTPGENVFVDYCPQGFSGYRTMRREWHCNPSTQEGWWGDDEVVDDSGCVCLPQAAQEEVFECPAGYTGTGMTRRNEFICPQGEWSGWQDVGGDCTCDSSAIQTRTTACPSGQSGVVEEQRNFDCGASPPDWGDWTEVNNLCGATTYRWVPKTAISGSGSIPYSVSAYGNCTTVGAQSSCSTPSGSGYNYYNACRCE